ncbi:GDSL-type esterase/lipase family protein [Corynebacterium heidelbergense]|uniref:Esterase n=1 Tax=Corynebacterium heidelbergense TaxID=2055947 RepID=A0A364V8D6_9CORY|nr:GDSL-type esterase/lipase family protein [Corynebacterium heidelbergense]RAV32826.1 esterase [Corynebacterium heidelbergense]
MKKKLTAALAAGLIGTSLAAAPAHAAPGANVVYFGDSFTANPDQVRNFSRGFNPAATDGYPSREGCLQAPDNAPRLLAERTGLAVDDWSCTAQTSRSALTRVDSAIRVGDIHSGTRSVVLALGMNNFGPFAINDGVNVADPGAVRAAYIADMHEAAKRIRSVAPTAQLVIQGQLSVSDPVSAMYCSVNVVPNMPAGFPIFILRDAENWNRQNQIDAAKEIGARYVEVKDPSANHNSCVADQERWVAGVIDTTTPNYHMMFHPSHAGSDFVAAQVAKVV